MRYMKINQLWANMIYRIFDSQKADWTSRELTTSGVSALVNNAYLHSGWINLVDCYHYSGVVMSEMASQITGVSIICSGVGSGADHRKHQSSASLALWGEFPGDRWIPRTKGQ